MKKHLKVFFKILSTKSVIMTLFLVTFFLNNIYALEKKEKDINQLQIIEKNQNLLDNYLHKIPFEDYILGPGDRLEITISSNLKPIFAVVNPNGTISLPELKRIYILGLTISELEKQLYKKYTNYLSNPYIKVDLIASKPINVYLKGEVRNPGLYQLGFSDMNSG